MKYLENYSMEELEKFRSNPSLNPKTNRKIKKDGPVYKFLVRLLSELDENNPPKQIVKKLRENSFIPQ
jgi:hypothetical protein